MPVPGAKQGMEDPKPDVQRAAGRRLGTSFGAGGELGRGSPGSVLHAERHQGDLLVLLVGWQRDRTGTAALGGPGTAGDRLGTAGNRLGTAGHGSGTAGDGPGTTMLQRRGLQDHRRLLIVLGALLHSPPRFPAGIALRAGQARAVLLQRPAVDFHGRGAHGGHRADLHTPPGLAALRGRAAGGGLGRGTAPRRALAGALGVVAEGLGVVTRLGGVVAVPGGGAGPRPALVVAARGGLARLVVAAAFLVEHPGVEMAETGSY